MTDQNKINDLMLERFILDELSPAQKNVVLKSIEQDPELKLRLAEIERSNAEIRQFYPAEKQVPQILDRIKRKKEKAPQRVRRTVWLAAPALAAAAAILILVAPFDSVEPPLDPGYEQVRLKGDSRLIVHRKTGETVELLADGDHVAAGDLIQLSYIAGEAQYGAILSVDGRGEVTLHFPGGTGDSSKLDHEGTQDLPFAYQLDDAPNFERFFFIVSSSPVNIGELLDRARELGPQPGSVLKLSEGWRAIELLLTKN